MTYKEAKRILHPDTTREVLAEIEYYGGFNGQEAQIKAANAACVVACEAIDKVLASQWVPVSERLPETVVMSNGMAYSEAVVTLTNEKKLVIAVYDGVDFVGDYDFWERKHITHWMPLPEPPKEDKT